MTAGRDIILVLRVTDKGTKVIKSFTAKSKSALKGLQTTTKATGGSFNKMQSSAMGTFKTFATGLLPVMGIVAAMGALRRGIADTIKTGREFERAFANVTTLMDESSEFTEKFKRELIGLSPTLGKTTDLAKGMYQALSAGVKPAGAIAFLEVVAKSAAAGLAELDETVKAIASTMNAYGMSTETTVEAVKNATDVSDVLFKTIKGGITTMPELAQGLAQVTAVAAGMNVPFEQVGAAIATLTKKGLTTRIAIMGLSRTLQGLLKPSVQTREAVKQLGIEFDATKLAGEGIPYLVKTMTDQMTDALPVIEKMTAAGRSEAEIMAAVAQITGKNVVAIAKLFPNVASLRTMLMLASQGGREFNAMMEEQKNRVGATEEAFKKQAATADFWLTALGNVFERMKVGFWEGITKPFKEGLKSADDFKEKFDAFAKSATEKALKFGETLGKIAKFLYDHRGLIKALIKVYVAWWVIKKKIMTLNMFGAMAQRATVFRSAMTQGAGAVGSLKIAVGGLTPKLLMMAKAGALAGAAFAGWKIGRWIGGIKLFGESIDEHIQRGMKNAAQSIPIVGKKIAELDYQYDKASKGLATSLETQKQAFAGLAQFMEKEMGRATTKLEDVVGALGERLLTLSSTGNDVADAWVKNWVIKEAAVMGVEVRMKHFEEDMAAFAQDTPVMFNALIAKIRSLKPAAEEATEAAKEGTEAIEWWGEAAEKFATQAGISTFDGLIGGAKEAAGALRYATSIGLSWNQSVEIMGKSILDLGDKIIPMAKMYKIDLPEAFMKAYHAAKRSELALEAQAKALEDTRSAAEGAADGILEAAKQIEQMGKAYSDWNKEMLTDFSKGIAEISKQSVAVLQEADAMIAEVYTSGKAKDALQAALEADKKRWDQMQKRVGDEIEAIGRMYVEKKKMINDYYDEEARKFKEMTKMKETEVGIVAEIEKMKLKLKKATTVGEIDALKASFGLRMGELRKQGLAEIEQHRKTALAKLKANKEKYLDLRLTELWNTLTAIHKAEQASRKKIEREWEGMGATLKQRLGTAFSGLSVIFRTLSDNYEGAMGDLLSATGSALDLAGNYFKESFEKKIPLTFEGLAKAIAPVLGQIGGAIGEMVSGAEESFAGLGASLGGMVGSIFGPVGEAVGSLLGGLVGGLFGKKEAETEAEKTARLTAEWTGGLISKFKEWGDVSEATAKIIAEDIVGGMKGYIAVSKHLASVIADTGVNQRNINDLWQRAGDIIHHFTDDVMKEEDAVKALGESFGLLVEGAQRLGTEGSKAMVDFILKLRQSGLEVKEVTDYINEQLGVVKSSGMNAAEGLLAMAKALPAGPAIDAVGELSDNVVDYVDEIDILRLHLESFFSKAIKKAQEFGTEGSKAMSDYIQAIKATGIEIEALTGYIDSQLGVVRQSGMNAVQGLEAMAKVEIDVSEITRYREEIEKLTAELAETEEGSEAYAELSAQIAEAEENLRALGTTGGESLAYLERQTIAVFNAMIENGASYFEAMQSMSGVFDALIAKHEVMGTTGGAAIQELMRIREVVKANEDLFNAIEGNLGVLNALTNTGSLNQRVMFDAAVQARNYYDSLIEAGLTGNQALAQMAPTLERLKYLAEEHGLEINATTQALIDQAEEQGLLGEQTVSVTDAMLAGFGELIKVLGGDIPAAFQAAMDSVAAMGDEGATAFDPTVNSVESVANQLGILERQTLAVFNAMIVNGASVAEAMDSIGPTLDVLAEKYGEWGIEGSAAIQELLRLREVTQANEELFSAIEGNLAVMNALANTGSLTQQVLTDSATAAENYYDQIVEAGLSGNQALAQMAPTLERLRFLAEEHGLALDDTTLALIAQAEEAGLLKEAELSMQDTMMAGFGLMLQAMGVDIPKAFQKSIDKMKDMEKGIAGSGLVSALKKVGGQSDTTFGNLKTSLETVITETDNLEEAFKTTFASAKEEAERAAFAIESKLSAIRPTVDIDFDYDVPDFSFKGNVDLEFEGGPGGGEGPEFGAQKGFRGTVPVATRILVHPREDISIIPWGDRKKSDRDTRPSITFAPVINGVTSPREVAYLMEEKLFPEFLRLLGSNTRGYKTKTKEALGVD